MFNFLAKKITTPPNAPENSAEAVNAWGKLNRVVDSAFSKTHLDVAENLLERMLEEFHFTPEQRASPLVVGMRDKIYKARLTVV